MLRSAVSKLEAQESGGYEPGPHLSMKAVERCPSLETARQRKGAPLCCS